MTTDVDRRDALARLIDPDAWGLYDDPRMRDDSIRNAVVKDSRKVAEKIVESGLMVSMKWDGQEYIRAKKQIIECTSRKGYCYSEEDGMDGYAVHDPKCSHWPNGATSGSNCIRAKSKSIYS